MYFLTSDSYVNFDFGVLKLALQVSSFNDRFETFQI